MKTVIAIFALIMISANLFGGEIRLNRFKKPFCMIGNGNHNSSSKTKLRTLKRYQHKISRKKGKFYSNKRKERKATLHGSPKWITYKYLAHRKYSKKEIQFAFLAMTLFGEARNLDENSMEMVARVINNRKKKRNYADTVADLAQFSTWYYRNRRDNVSLLCPSLKHTKNWQRAVKVAYKHFNKRDKLLGATHYFSPYNMVPKYKTPGWSRGKHAVSYGGHVFLINKRKYKGQKKVVYIPKRQKRLRAVRGRIIM